MHYLVLADDHPGAEGQRRRAQARERHLAQAAEVTVHPGQIGPSFLDRLAGGPS